jgi:hypothetical protein
MHVTGLFGAVVFLPVAGIVAAIYLVVRLNSRR